MTMKLPGYKPATSRKMVLDFFGEILSLVNGTYKRTIEKSTTIGGLWDNLLTEKPPKDFMGKIGYWIDLVIQSMMSEVFGAAGQAAFLLEESVQAFGMGAYMLYVAKDWESLDNYIEYWKMFIDGCYEGTKGLAAANPLVAGAASIYMEAAAVQYQGLRIAVDKYLAAATATSPDDIAKKAKTAREGALRILSSPSFAELWIDGENTGYLTPETLKGLDAGVHVIELRKYNTKREAWDVYAFETLVKPGRTVELRINIPEKITSAEESGIQPTEGEIVELPKFIKAEVTGNYALDGDTFETVTGERIRILAIDAPELGQPWADIAKEYLEMLIEDKSLTLRIQSDVPFDSYGRTLAFVQSYKGDVSKLMLAAGLATAFIADDATYVPLPYLAAEKIAKLRRIGIWSGMK